MASGSFVSAFPQFFARSVYSSCIYIPHLLPCKPCSPSDFRQALPANDADGEAPSKVVGLRGERLLWETPGRQEGKKKSRCSPDCSAVVVLLSRCCPGCPAVVRFVPLLSRCCPAVVPLRCCCCCYLAVLPLWSRWSICCSAVVPLLLVIRDRSHGVGSCCWNSQCMCHRVCESFCESFLAPSAFRQALPANGADGEAPLKVVGLRGSRAARA